MKENGALFLQTYPPTLLRKCFATIFSKMRVNPIKNLVCSNSHKNSKINVYDHFLKNAKNLFWPILGGSFDEARFVFKCTSQNRPKLKKIGLKKRLKPKRFYLFSPTCGSGTLRSPFLNFFRPKINFLHFSRNDHRSLVLNNYPEVYETLKRLPAFIFFFKEIKIGQN